ncbi:MAG: SDR family NAD(P)-dependent oxidoreductase [Gammaproteobacteria bacterium]|nr:SDR family NAD(P)-dependent oxidoreductase [Gammaproteobacteria bacterium]
MIPWLAAGKTAVVTGGANGIGLATARRFRQAGMNVLIADRDEAALQSAAAALPDGTGAFATLRCDVSDPEQVEELRTTAYDRFGAVHCLMNNAGAALGRPEPWEDLSVWRRQIDVNLWGIIHGCHAFVPSLLEADERVAIINTGSKQGITNPPGGYAYNLSKAGVLAYTQSLAHALRQRSDCLVSVHLLVPGFTYSNMIARFIPEKPPGAWTPGQVVDHMVESLERGDFHILCPDGDTPPELDHRRIQWNADDIIKNRPALSRWHPDFAAEYEAFING